MWTGSFGQTSMRAFKSGEILPSELSVQHSVQRPGEVSCKSLSHIWLRHSGTGLENRRAAMHRGFKSLPLRFVSKALRESGQDATRRSGNGLRLVVSGEPEGGQYVPGFNYSQPESAVRGRKCDKNEPTELALSPPTLDEVRRTVQDCQELPEPIRAACSDVDTLTTSL